MTRTERWKVEDTRIGDFIRVQIINKKGDRNLDGAIVEGKIKDLVPSHKMVRLESGWCCHTKDLLLVHARQDDTEGEDHEGHLAPIPFTTEGGGE